MAELPNPAYSRRLYNEDLGPLGKQSWGWYNIFAFWMSDIHSVGGYLFAGSLFALGLSSWQVLVSLLTGIGIVNALCNYVARPSQQAGVPYPVVCRLAFGVLGARVPAVIRGMIAVAWYGIQTYVASSALNIVLIRFFPTLGSLRQHGFAGLSCLGWIGFITMWLLQALVFWRGMDAIRKFIDWAGPAVYVVMALLAGYVVWKAGLGNIRLTLGEVKYTGWHAIFPMLSAIALVVSYFSGPMLNFGDFSRYCATFSEVKRGNFWGLPVNFLAFSVVTVVITSGTVPVFGHMITDPIEVVGRIDNTVAAVLGALTFAVATIGINIVANFVSPAFDFSNAAPGHVSWRAGGFIAAIGAVFITPWKLFNSPMVIHSTLDVLAAFIGPLFGILIADFYLIRDKTIKVDELYSDQCGGEYWYKCGVNPRAMLALVPSVAAGLMITFSGWRELAAFNWFIGCGLGFASYLAAMRGHPIRQVRKVTPDVISEGCSTYRGS